MCAKRLRTSVKFEALNLTDAKKRILKIKKLEGSSQATIYHYNIVFNDLINFLGEDKEINKIDVEDARDFVNWLRYEKANSKSPFKQVARKGTKPSSVNTYLQKARAAFNILINEKLLDKNVFLEVKNIKFQKQKIEVLTVDEIKAIFNAFDKNYYAQFRSYVLLHTLLDTLGRVAETTYLKKQDVDLENRLITFNNTKSKKFRIVPISKDTSKLLEELIYENEQLFENEYVFLTNDGGRLKPHTFRAHTEKVLKEAGITKRFHPHLLRHTGSEMFLRQSGNIRVLQKILGHSDLVITQRYAHVLDDQIKVEHEKFNAINLINNHKTRIVKRK